VRRACLLLLPLLACSRATRPAGDGAAGAAAALPTDVSTGADPRFDWFVYEGRDPVHDGRAPGPREYRNPILSGFHPDPSNTRVGDDYYLVTSTFAYFPGIPIFHSRDLVSWRQIGNAIHRPSQLDFDTLGLSRGVFAPTIEHHDGTFYVLNTCVDCGGNFVVTASDPRGPWSDPTWLPEVGGIDPSLFFDDDGKAYILNNDAPIGPPLYEGHRAIWIQEFDAVAKRTVGPRTMLVNGGVDLATKPIWIEGPHIYKVGGKYYLSAAEGGTAVQHSQVVLRSDSVRGPYVPGPHNPILTQRHLDPARPFPITSAGHADLVQTQNGDWWATFLAVRPYADDFYNTGRETFLMPVRWVDGWPVITAGAEAVPYVHAKPALPAAPAPPVPMSGNFTVREEFDDTTLAPYWLFIRTPRERWYDLDAPRGSLTLRARPADIARRTQPSFIGRRQQHTFASASVAMRYAAAGDGDRAGLVAFQNEDHFYFLGVTLADGAPVVRVERRAGTGPAGRPEVVASAPLHSAAGAPVYLRIVARGGRYDFHYGYAPDAWIALAENADGTILSTKTAGGFVGVVFGMYAYTPQR